MEDSERQERLQTASALLADLKRHGGSARFAAEWLGVSPTTITNWHRVVEKTKRKQGVPSDEQLLKLATLAVWQVRQALNFSRMIVGEGIMRARERGFITRALAADYRAVADDLREQADKTATMLHQLRSVAEAHGPGVASTIVWPPEAHWESEDIGPGSPPAPKHLDVAKLFRDLEIPDEDIQAADAELQGFFKARNRKFLEQSHLRVEKKKRVKKK